MNKTLAETLKLLLNNQKMMADQIALLNEKVKILQQAQGQKPSKKSTKRIMLNHADLAEKVTIH